MFWVEQEQDDDDEVVVDGGGGCSEPSLLLLCSGVASRHGRHVYLSCFQVKTFLTTPSRVQFYAASLPAPVITECLCTLIQIIHRTCVYGSLRTSVACIIELQYEQQK